ncbi:glycoside hydrolase family 3 N-terminal domain-containing protein [Synechococcus sp. CCY9202]|uniref:glycoside hydrolase family 3 N-terminal domain-containing protein n=1 Tax=Synechococcus sp. CCY9202 TaxID=174698 RepID=UPI002B1EF6B0|nr:glycoside hydrolase family 3 N-terminal domain-containing protein [Synechococcus sp. CCY9202]MEA5424628.1 glycoside hydrolase family 3 N-terminal domain-containing protein [Synechococcus sp. CCY9202]
MTAAGAGAGTATEQDLRRLVAELLVVRCSGHLSDDQRRYPRWELDNATLRRLLAEGVGGVILLGGSAAELGLRCRQLQAWSGQPLLLCADVEEGVGQRFEGASWLAPPLTLGRLYQREPGRAEELAERYGRCTGAEARELGLNWVLAPVCDVNNNPANPVINLRAWGEDPATAAALATAFLRGAQAEGVLCCAKHFPGHGDTAEDSHLELPRLDHERTRLEQVELPPFRAAIAAGVASVMTAHLLLSELDREQPATLSPAVLDGLLRQELGFEGLIVTDALVMEAIAARTGGAEAAVLALVAGADLVLMPENADAAIDAILEAVQQGRLSPERLAASQQRRRRALASVAEPAAQQPSGADVALPLRRLSEGPRAEHRALARELVQGGLQHRGGRLTVRPQGTPSAAGCNLIRIDNALQCPALPLGAPALNLPAAAGFRSRLLEPRSPSPWSQDPRHPLNLESLGSGAVLLQLFLRGNPFTGGAGGQEPWEQAIQQLQEIGRLAALVVYGSPYRWDSLVAELDPQIPAAYCPAQTPLAQRYALEAIGLGEGSQAGSFTD